ncbi:olfactory receptor 4K15-like [Gopherus evgoodei]|uniref:olfactory receptor 4K15-like n=1 Tax=Gopherus evgoodei TaxID=1825980 RepID=UPI0011CFAFD1|nr:olfactory receptor 4K15-like [Gopherus evgoodei]
MEKKNLSSPVTEFVLLGLTQSPELQQFLYVALFIICVNTWLGNFIIITTVISDHQLHMPTYFLLPNLAFLDLSDSSVNSPKLLSGLLSQHKTISFNECLLQMFFFQFMAGTIGLLCLVGMVIDWYVAIYKPLRYLTIMNQRVCMGIMVIKLACIDVQMAELQMIFNSRTQCMESEMSNRTTVTEFLLLGFFDIQELQILHFVMFLVIYLAALMRNLLIIIVVVFDHHLHTPMYFFLMNLSILVISFISVPVPKSMAISLMNTRSISYSGSFAYLKPSSSSTSVLDLMVAILYSVMLPMMNPIIYSMRNKKIKAALRKLMAGRLFIKNELSIFHL